MAKPAIRANRGFTLTELLVVLGITVVLVTQVSAALQQSREVARREQCKNNLKHLGLAMHNYHDTFNTFPPGWVGHYRDADSDPGYGWPVMILPFVEQAALYNLINFSRMPAEPTPEFKHLLPIFRCPADTMLKVNPWRKGFGTCNYSGNFGSVAVPRLAPGPLADCWPGGIETPEKTNGIFSWNSKIGIRMITDGTSNTFMMGERGVKSAGGIWPGITSNKNETDLVTDCSAGNEINSGIAAFSSGHGKGINMLMCDGAVRFIDDGIPSHAGEGPAMGLFQKLGERNDGNPVQGF